MQLVTDIKFGFKETDKKDENDKKVIGEDGKVVKVPAPEAIEGKPVPQLELTDVQEILNKGDQKEIKLLLEALNAKILEACKDQIGEDGETSREKIRADGFNLEQLSWNYIANIPPGVRGGAGIAKEVWDAFKEDYIGVMLHHGKTAEKAELGAKLLLQKLQPIKLNKKALSGLQQNLFVWQANTKNGEDFTKLYEFLTNKLDTYLAADEDAVAAAI